MKVTCPICDYEFEIPHSSSRKLLTCRKCESQFHLHHAEGVGQKVTVIFMVIALGLFITSGVRSGKLKLSFGKTGWNVNAYKTIKRMGSRWGKLVRTEKKIEPVFKNLPYNQITEIYAQAIRDGKITAGKVRPQDIGKTVVWRGKLAAIGTTKLSGKIYMKVRHKAASKDDVTVYLNENREYNFLKLKPGAYITYSGVLKKSGYGKKNHVLESGSILYIDNFD
ncbi:MAG: hypothetical protein KAJ07_09185 [Planctomycetes bacterium]|nr:hypothetical protein [Planctomycetota bacterium]